MKEGREADLERLDVLLVRRGLAPTRVKARALILAGQVLSGESRLEKPGQRVREDVPLKLREGRRFVSRGGHKLAPALDRFSIVVANRDVLDVGASTGGFTQVLLEAGARRLVALDVGRGQLDWTLRRDPRVRVLEGLNARHLVPALLPFLPYLAVVDVSFISLKLVLPKVVACLADPGEIVALVKPQFEVGRGRVGRGGVVRDLALHRSVLANLGRHAADSGWGPVDLCAAALRGAEGNQEYFLHLAPGSPGLDEAELAQRIASVTEPHEEAGS
jgi:23S rRNA (cytidine1920-2'-O)/16S rRNA (cytidine1409-2'-O)-methyltransferase